MKEVLEIKLEGMSKLSNIFAYLLSERLIEYDAFAFIKKDAIAVDLSHASDRLTLNKMIEMIEDSLNNLELKDNYTITIDKERIVIKIINTLLVEELLRKYGYQQDRLLICPHCGYVTIYPELLREHIKIHYLL